MNQSKPRHVRLTQLIIVGVIIVIGLLGGILVWLLTSP